MRKSRAKRGDETGDVSHGRHTFHRHEYEVIRAWVRVKIEQVQKSLDAIKQHCAKRPTPELAGQREYWATVLSYLNGVYRGGMRSIDPDLWEEAWRHVTTVERYAGPDAQRDDQPSLPGME